ncbi:protein EMBRYO SAC DEVELOPMENT ARREST 30 [Argentina anserina]|uniref:protein EMBRYO SAC DEVELOPMENT ARREST 30 n=1 Tax=Argentina anserina TaxID=57926 RepID=UPI0021764579|nr:protein EMBRYO SAC DEVELOPMENT ARREST 30 [Potentilla anserina]
MVLFKSKIKWVALFVLLLSFASLLRHLSIAKYSSLDLVHYSALTAFHNDFDSALGTLRTPSRKLWAAVKPLQSLQPYANPRTNYPAPNQHSTRFIYAKIFGDFARIRSSICDLVIVSRLLNATLVVPEIQQTIRSKGISNRFKSFSYLYDEEQFIASLKNDIIVVKSLPDSLKAARKRNEFKTFKPKNSASPEYYIKEVLPMLKKAKVVGLILADGGCLQSILPPSMVELQRLRCRVAFHSLQFRQEIQILGRRMVERLRAWGQPFLAYNPGLLRETLAYHGCGELFQDVHTELIQYRRAQMIKRGIIKEELSVNSHLRRLNGSCPLMPEEVGILLRAMGYPPKTIIYLTGSETFGGQRVLVPLRAMFANLVDRTSLCTNKELSDLLGPETPLPLNPFQPPPAKSEEQLKEEWKRAGPRPRPLPPPPSRPIYQHEKEGWYGWITERDTEPEPSMLYLRMQAHRLLWDALDYIVSVESNAFFPGFHNDGSGWPDFSSLVMGHRLYEMASSRTYRPDRKVVAELFNMTRDNIYHHKHNWILSVQEHLNKSLGEEGLIRQSVFSKPASFISHPLPECTCRISSADSPGHVKGNDGRIVYGGEEECPKWMQHGQDVQAQSTGEEVGNSDDNESSDYGNTVVEVPESNDSDRKDVNLVFNQDEEMDPND